MSITKKVANQNFEDAGALTTRHVSRHGLKSGRRKAKYLVNRRAKKVEAQIAFNDESV